MVAQEKDRLLSTGNSEMDQKLKGGISLDSLVFLEGEPNAGKSLLVQHLSYRALTSGLPVAYYTTENTIKDLMAQMVSLGLDVTDYFLCDRLRVYPLRFSSEAGSEETLSNLWDHFKSLPPGLRFIVVDSLTELMAQSDERPIVDFFADCKRLCDLGWTILAVVCWDATNDQLLGRVRSICDTHLVLRVETQGGRRVRVMEVPKIGNVQQAEGNVLGFDIGPEGGIEVIPLTNTRA